MLSEPNISYKPFWGICRPLNSWRANSPNPIQIYCAGSFKGFWSRRINDKDRLIYKIDEGAIYIISCRQHYTDH